VTRGAWVLLVVSIPAAHPPAAPAAAAQVAPPGREATTPVAATADTAGAPPLSPWGAFWRSLLVPGWGQAELDAEVRGAVYFVAEATSAWMWVRTQRRLDAARRRAASPADPLVRARTQQREDWIVLTVFWAFFNAADAWVTAHLHGFETKPIPVPGEPVAWFVGVSWPTGVPPSP
jgi:hypothetical protein